MTGHIARRSVLGSLPLLLSACGLSERPFVERRQWPLAVVRPIIRPGRSGGIVLEVRALRAAPDISQRGLLTLQVDGSIRSNFYEEWSVLPALAVEASLRQWLEQSGRFAAVSAAGDRLAPDIMLDGELTALWTDLGQGVARATIAFSVLDLRPVTRRVLLQTSVTAVVPLSGPDAPASVLAQRAAVAAVCTQIEDRFDEAPLARLLGAR